MNDELWGATLNKCKKITASHYFYILSIKRLANQLLTVLYVKHKVSCKTP